MQLPGLLLENLSYGDTILKQSESHSNPCNKDCDDSELLYGSKPLSSNPVAFTSGTINVVEIGRSESDS